MSSNVFFPKIPSIENVNKPMHVVGKTHEGRKDHSLDILSNVVSFVLLDDFESVATSIDSDDVSKEVVSKEDNPKSKLPENESNSSENLDEFESEMHNYEDSRDSCEDSNKSYQASDSVDDNVPIAKLNTKGKKKFHETDSSPSKTIDDEQITQMMTGKRK
ncbi:unnamed protein product [Citrullus colocynthis]|uniref:Uncharacterized protein n=1 Tax=Citrullus colocynthis TaxID=252529 RepID=A0ABP0YFE9_9ROSI